MRKKNSGKLIFPLVIICWLLISLLHGYRFKAPAGYDTGCDLSCITGCDTGGPGSVAANAAGTVQTMEAAATGSVSVSELSLGSPSEEEASFEIHILDVGQGLCVLLEADGSCMLYDGGGREYSSYVVAYLKENDIDTLSYLVASHYDEDHISGLVGVLNTTTVEMALTPDYTADSDIYRSFRSMLESNGAVEVHPAAGDTYQLGSATVQILSPAEYTCEDENDNSIALRVEYGEFSCILTGDAGEDAEADMVRSGYTLDSDLYIVGHHGSSTSSTEAFVGAVSPDYAVISAGLGNSYGHPTEKTLSTLKQSGAELYRTDLQGEIICYTDGANCRFNTEASGSWLSGTELSQGSDTAEADPPGGTSAGASDGSGSGESSAAQEYVLNTRSMKFHYPDCQSVSLMSDANKKTVTADRETLIEEGYSPCGNCNP